MSDDPIELYHKEFKRALATETFDATRCALATADAQGKPSVRFVLCKHVDSAGFVFYTNRESQKGRELDENPQAALAFHWSTTGVQVRTEGKVTLVSAYEADEYFSSRAHDSQLGAWASQQSRPLQNRAELEQAVKDVRTRYENKNIPRPAYWVGYRLAPERIEFWYNREARLHERVNFERSGQGWTRTLLSP